MFRPRVGELLVNTGLLVVLSCTATAVIGTAAAFLVERVRVAGSRFWGPLLVAPLAIPAFVTSYGWVSMFPGIDGLFGATLIMTLAYFPFVFLPVAAALRGLDPAWEEQARTLGLRPGAVLPPGGAAAAAAGHPGRRAAGRAALPVRVRRVQHAAVRHLHHRDLRPVLVQLRQRGGEHAGRSCWWPAA